jgi:sec-independent protein translocase protein TatA
MLLAFLDPSPTTLLILGALAVLLFGERLPEVARSIGKGFMEFKKGMQGIEQEIRNAVDSATTSVTSATPLDDAPEREEATAPKFEPPPAEPKAPGVPGP